MKNQINMDAKLTIQKLTIKRQTEKAYLLNPPLEIWIPKSVVNQSSGAVAEWFLKKNGHQPFIVDLGGNTQMPLITAKDLMPVSSEKFPAYKAPEGLRLYQHQIEDLPRIINSKASALVINWEMGLGKTLASILTAKNLQETKDFRRFLVVCPASLRGSWRREISLFWPLCPLSVETVFKKSDIKKIKISDSIILISYDLLSALADELPEYRPDLLILDESQYIKNRKAGRTVSSLFFAKKDNVKTLCLTGTPILNSPVDLWPVYYLNYKNSALSFYQFGKRFSNPVMFGETISKFQGVRNTDELKEIIAPFFLIRKKNDCIDLPEKLYKIEVIEPDTKEAKELAKESLEYSDIALSAIDRGLSDAKNGADISRIRSKLAILKAAGSIEIINNIMEEKKKLIVFGWHIEALTLLQDQLSKNYKTAKITGEVSGAKRDEVVKDFQNLDDNSIQILFCQIKAAGVGLTLTASDTVLFLEKSWTPADNWQAEDRIHRIGQKQTCNIISLQISGSLDQRVDFALSGKTRTIQKILG